MAVITLEQIDQNILALAPEQQDVAEMAFDKLSQPELDAVMAALDVSLEQEAMPQEAMPQEADPGAVGVAGIIDDENVETTDENTVSDKSNVNFPEGAFIINAAAVRGAGVGDILKMTQDAADTYERLTGEKIDVGKITRPSEQVQGDVPGAISELEAFIDPRLVPIIGEDRLEKINNRGVKETEEKLEETQPQEGAPPAQPTVRAAPGGKVDSETDMLARLLIAEAEGEGETGMTVVANVVSNRIKDRGTNFAKQNTFRDVISAKLPSGSGNEFTGYNNKRYKEANTKGKQWQKALEIARKAIDGTLEDITSGATFYRNKNEKAKQGKGSNERGQEFFDKRVNSGRFVELGDFGKHTVYLDVDSTPYMSAVKRGTTEPLSTLEPTPTEKLQQGLQPIPDSELPTPENIRRRGQGADTMIIYTDPEEDVKPFDPVKNRREKRRQRRLAATRDQRPCWTNPTAATPLRPRKEEK